MANIEPMEWTPVIRKVQPVGRRDEPRKNGIITLLPEFVERHDLIKNKKVKHRTPLQAAGHVRDVHQLFEF